MKTRRVPASAAALLALVCCCTSASAQTAPPIQGKTTTVPDLTLADTLTVLVRPFGGTHIGDALVLATELGVATAPLGGPSSGGFVIKLDPDTGLQVRTATTFGPSFAERALTSGEGKASLGVSFMSVDYDRLGTLSPDRLRLLSTSATSPADARVGTVNLALTSNTVVIAGRMGVTDKLDVGVAVPVVTVKVRGTSTLQNGSGEILKFASGSGVTSGLGDVAGLAKYRFFSFGGGQPDPGGLAVMATMRLPTGQRENLRGLGVTRTLVSLIASGGRGRIRPHANVGFEWWSKGVGVASDQVAGATVTARHQVQYAAGMEFEAAPKVTLLVDLLGGEILGGGTIGFNSSQTAVTLPDGIRRVTLTPGLKMNLKGKLVLSVNALVALLDDGLHARVTPVAGIDLTF